MNLSSKELAAFPQGKLNELENPNKRAMYGAMGINVGNVQEAQGIKSILQSAVAGQGAQQMAPGGSIVDRMAMAVKAKVDQQKQREEAMKVAMGFRGMESAKDGVGSLSVPGQDYAEGGIVPFAKGGQPKVAAKEEEDDLDAARRAADARAIASMGGLTRPEEVDEEGMFKRVYESNQAMGQPYVDKMNSLIEKMRPDAEGIRGQNRSNSIIQAGLAMMQARGGPGFAGGLAGIAGGAQRGLNQYQEGDRNLQGQLQKHQAFEMEGIKNELGMRKDDLRYAQGMVEQARKEFGTKSREFRAAEANAERVRQEYIDSFLKNKDLRRREAEAISRDAYNQQKLLAAIGRNNSGGGAGNSKEELRAATTRFNQIQNDIRAVDKRINSKDFDPFSYSKDPTYQQIKTQKGRDAADAWARKQAKEAELAEVFRMHGSSPEEFMDLGRVITGKAGIARLPTTPSAPAPAPTAGPQKGDYVYNMKTGKSEQIK
jgi:hypothetical protein